MSKCKFSDKTTFYIQNLRVNTLSSIFFLQNSFSFRPNIDIHRQEDTNIAPNSYHKRVGACKKARKRHLIRVNRASMFRRQLIQRVDYNLQVTWRACLGGPSIIAAVPTPKGEWRQHLGSNCAKLPPWQDWRSPEADKTFI